jgi:hypothetical protein
MKGEVPGLAPEIFRAVFRISPGQVPSGLCRWIGPGKGTSGILMRQMPFTENLCENGNYIVKGVAGICLRSGVNRFCLRLPVVFCAID